MANEYKDGNGIKKDYLKLSPENQHKAYQYMKNLLRLQRAESGLKKELSLVNTRILLLKKLRTLSAVSAINRSLKLSA